MPFNTKDPQMQDFLNAIGRETFGMGPKDAIEKGICLVCKEPAVPRCTTDAGKKEYFISGMCEVCWDATVAGGEASFTKGEEE